MNKKWRCSPIIAKMGDKIWFWNITQQKGPLYFKYDSYIYRHRIEEKDSGLWEEIVSR